MNVNPESTPAPAPESDNTTSQDAVAPAKPARRPRAAKVSLVDSDATPSAEGAQESVSSAGDAAAPKPRRRRVSPSAREADAAPVKAASDAPPQGVPQSDQVAVVAAAGDARPGIETGASGSVSAELPPPSMSGSTYAASASVALQAHSAVPDERVRSSETQSPPEAPAATGRESSAEPGQGDESGAEGGPLPGGQDESPRSRRRNRRDRKRGDGNVESGSHPQAVAVPPEMPAATVEEASNLFAQVLSGEFDVEEEVAMVADAPDEATKRVLAPEPEAPKLHKVLAQAGIGSRRDMEELILDGHITVNGEPAHIGQRISFGDQVKVNGKPVKLRIMPLPARIIAYHKPVGEIVTHDDPQNRPTVFRRLPRLQQGKWQSVGRLDINTEGLLLFTNSGELANQLMHPRFGVEREYAVRVLGDLSGEAKAQLLDGVMIEGQKCGFRSIEEGGGDGANRWYRVVITEGRNREVRKLFDAVGLTVSRLIRIRYGTVVLPHGLKRGVWVDLDEADVRAIRRLASGDRAPRDAQGGGRPNDRQGGKQRSRQDNRQENRQEPRQGARPNDRGRGNAPQPGRFNENPASAVDAVRDNERDVDHDADSDMDFDPRSIPNPLEQTFDKRFVQNPRSPAGGRGFGRGGGGFGAGGSAPPPGPSGGKKGQGPSQPDPLQTSLGFIGADAFHRKSKGGGGGRGGNRGGSGGGGGGGGYGGRGGGRGGR